MLNTTSSGFLFVLFKKRKDWKHVFQDYNSKVMYFLYVSYRKASVQQGKALDA